MPLTCTLFSITDPNALTVNRDLWWLSKGIITAKFPLRIPAFKVQAEIRGLDGEKPFLARVLGLLPEREEIARSEVVIGRPKGSGLAVLFFELENVVLSREGQYAIVVQQGDSVVFEHKWNMQETK